MSRWRSFRANRAHMANLSSARRPPRPWVERSGRGTLSLARSSYEPQLTTLDLNMKLNAPIPYKSHTLTPKQDRKSLQYYCDIDGDNGEGCPLEETISKAVENARLILDEQDADRDYYDKVIQAAKEWKERWPNHCTECGGWGLHFYPGKYSGPPENCYPDEQEPCSALPDDVCHRCGEAQAIVEDPTTGVIAPCRFCGWHCDDGCPTP